MSKPTFDELYTKALAYQKNGDVQGMTALLNRAYAAGLPTDELSMLSALAEGALQFQARS